MKTLRKYHKWPSLIIGAFLLLFAVSGIVLNHRSLFYRNDVSRKLLPPGYRYQNWNLAAIKGTLNAGHDSLLIYGNIGIWLTDSSFSRFTDYTPGFEEGTDNHKIFSLCRTGNNQLYAGTLNGLMHYNKQETSWEKVLLPEKNPRVVKVASVEDRLFVMTRDHLYSLETGTVAQIMHHPLPRPAGADGKVSLFTTFWVLHSGELLGIAGKLIVDLLGLLIIFFTLSGYYYTLLPSIARRTAGKLRKQLYRLNKFSVKWHNKLGVWSFAFLLITVVTGMFLRPPLLIPIASSRVAPIPGTMLANANFWHDKLRDFVIDTSRNRIIFSTTEGFFETGLETQAVCQPFEIQPPVSVMGITVFEQTENGTFLIGSFSGLYHWHPDSGMVTNAITGLPYQGQEGGSPFGANAVSGIITDKAGFRAYIDYDAGWVSLRPGTSAPTMPETISGIPISLWNLALEVHTGRIFSVFLGGFYILYVPLMGITTLTILVTGFLMWNRTRRRKRNKPPVTPSS